MSDYPSRAAFEIDRRTAFAVFSLLGGVLSFLLIGSAGLMPAAHAPAELLSHLASHRGAYVLAAVAVLVWAVIAIPFVVGLGALVRPGSPALAEAATLLSAGGILLLSFGTFGSIGALLAIVAASDAAPNAATATYQAVVWANLSYYLSDPGLMTLGFGQLLFAGLYWNGRVLPRWVTVLGFVGGTAGLLTLAVYQTPLLALVQLASFGVWGLAAGAILLRRH
jgi:hypothetical protein